MAIEGFDDADFQELAPKDKKGAASDLVFSTVTARQPGNVKVQFNLSEALLAEISAQGARFSIAYAPAKKAFRIKPEQNGRFELITLPRGTGRHFLRAPLPPGLVESKNKFEPEYFVDIVGRQIIVECPEELLHKAKLLAPPAAPLMRGPLESASIAPPSAAEVDEGGMPALSINSVPTMINGQKFKPAEAIVAYLLATRGLVTKSAILSATVDPANAADDERDEKIADVYLAKVRPRLAEMGISVETVWGQGWKIQQTMRSKLRNLIELAHMELHS